jgi:hypothetical protein
VLAIVGGLVGAAVGDATYPANAANGDFSAVFLTRADYEWIDGIAGFVLGASLGLVVWVGWRLQRWFVGRRSHARLSDG